MFGVEAVNLFKLNFDREGFIYGSRDGIKKWKPTKNNKGRKTLKKGGRLQRGIQIKKIVS